MSRDNPVSDVSEDEKKSYGWVGRIIMFLFIAGPGSVLAFGLWVRIGGSMSNATGKVDSFSVIIFVLWLAGMIGSAITIFRK